MPSEESQNLAAIMDLPGWRIISASDVGSHVEIHAEPPSFWLPAPTKRVKRRRRDSEGRLIATTGDPRVDPEVCTRCAVDGPAWASNGVYATRILDLPSRGKPVQIVAKRRKFYCPVQGCDALANSSLPGVAERFRMTDRLVELIRRRYHEVTISQIERETGVSRARLSNVIDHYIAGVQTNRIIQDVRVVAVDERLSRAEGDYVSIVSDGLTGRPIATALGRGEDAVAPIFSYLNAHHPVEAVSMDFAPAYRAAAKRFLPRAAVVTDKAHALRLVRNEMKKASKSYGKKLKGDEADRFDVFWTLQHTRQKKLTEEEREFRAEFLNAHPKLADLYDANNRFRRIWNATDAGEPTRADAEVRLDAWLRSLKGHLKKAFANSTTRFSRSGTKSRRQDFLNYFPFPEHQAGWQTYPPKITNARAEKLNQRIARIERDGRGYGKRSRDAKALLASFGPSDGMFLCDRCDSWFDPEYAVPVAILRIEDPESVLSSGELPEAFECDPALHEFLDNTGYEPAADGTFRTPVLLWPPFKSIPANFGICRFCAGLTPEGFERPAPLPDFSQAMSGTRIPTFFGTVETRPLPTVTERINRVRKRRLERERKRRAGDDSQHVQGDFLDDEP